MKIHTLFMVLFVCAASAHAGPYVFPVTPASPGWADLTIAERIAAYQIPEDTLVVMSTEDVYLTYVTCIMLYNICLSSSGYQQGFDWVRHDHNFVSALMDRPDVIEVVMEHYCAFVIDENNRDDINYQDDIDFTQILLNQYEIIASMSSSEKKTILEKAVSIDDIKQSLHVSSLLYIQEVVLMGRILLMDEYPPIMDAITADPDFKEALDRGRFSAPYDSLLRGFTRDYLASINHCEDHTPVAFEVLPPYPNPFNPTTTISYAIPASGRVTLSVYSITGQKVATLVDELQEAGSHSVVFDGKGLASGVYFYRLETAGAVKTGRMLMVK